MNKKKDEVRDFVDQMIDFNIVLQRTCYDMAKKVRCARDVMQSALDSMNSPHDIKNARELLETALKQLS